MKRKRVCYQCLYDGDVVRFFLQLCPDMTFLLWRQANYV